MNIRYPTVIRWSIDQTPARAAWAVLLICAIATAWAKPVQPGPGAGGPAAAMPGAGDASSGVTAITEHTLHLEGQTIHYRATAGTLVIEDDKGTPTASMFYIAYTRSDVGGPGRRPLTFFYNGGPGSSSVFLHLGAFGPQRVVAPAGTMTSAAPPKLTENQDSLLGVTDEVFIDAVGTGFSHALGKSQDKEFWGVDADTQAFGRFIESYVTRNGRWSSPKFLVGESYGTLRSVLLGNYLQTHYFMNLAGIVLMSSVLDMETILFRPGEDLPYVLQLPSYAATACYHKLLPGCPAAMDEVIRRAKQFALTDYASALLRGSALGASARQALAQRLAELTGLTPAYILQSNLRVPPTRFTAQLQRNQDLVTGRLDSRLSGYSPDPLADTAPYDPLVPAIGGDFTAAINEYLRQDLKYSGDGGYIVFSAAANTGWSWAHASAEDVPGSPNVESTLDQALIMNPSLRVQVEAGYFDLTTPFLEAEYAIGHLELPPQLRSHVAIEYYASGHMIYLNDLARAKLRDNISRLITSSPRAAP